MQKVKLKPYLILYTKINLTWTKLNEKTKSIKLFPEYIEVIFMTLNLMRNFRYDSKKMKKKYIKLYQNQKLLSIKGPYKQSENIIYSMGENIYKPYIW